MRAHSHTQQAVSTHAAGGLQPPRLPHSAAAASNTRTSPQIAAAQLEGDLSSCQQTRGRGGAGGRPEPGKGAGAPPAPVVA